MLLLVLSIIASLTAEGQAWRLKTNVAEIVPGSTTNVQLICTRNKASSDSPVNFYRIRITKANAFCSKITFADFHLETNRTYQRDDDVVVTSYFAPNQTAFLKVTWPSATRDTAGAYGCEIESYTQDDDFEIVSIGPKLIREELLTRNDVNKLISAATADLERKQRALELEIDDLKTSMNDSIESAKQQCQKESEKSRTEISDLRQRTEFEYTTKDELAVAASDLRNSTMDELRELRLEKEKEHNQIYSLIQNTTRDLKRTISKLDTESNECCGKLTTSIEGLETHCNQSLHKFNEEVTRLFNLLTSIDEKYENITKDLMSLAIKKDTTLCPTATTSVRPTTQTSLPTSTSTRMTTSTMTTTSTTTPTTPIPCNKRQWPGSPFALVKPVSRCTQLNKMAAESKTISYTSFYSAPDDKKLNISHLLRMNVQSGYLKRRLEFCSKNDTLPDTTAWPKGSYCILQQGKCPEQFQTGQMHYFVSRRSQDLGFFLFPFCCRNDGAADSPIYLPCEESFYLYRYAGVCQKVAGMEATVAYVTVDEMDDVSISVYSSGYSPDVNSKKETILLCHYRR